MVIERVVELVGRGHTLRAALAACGWTAEEWAAQVAADPDLGRRALPARGRADFVAESLLIDAAGSGGKAGADALEELLARRRLDLPLGRTEERSALDRLVSDRAALDALADDDRALLDAGLAALAAVEALALRVLG